MDIGMKGSVILYLTPQTLFYPKFGLSQYWHHTTTYCKISLLVETWYNLFSISDVTNFRVLEICRILVCNWHKPQYLSSLNCFCDFFLFLPTKTCNVPSINASSKWRNKLGQKLYILIIYTLSTQYTFLKRFFIRIFHCNGQVLIAGYLFILWTTSSPKHRVSPGMCKADSSRYQACQLLPP